MKRFISRIIGKVFSVSFPKAIQLSLNRLFIRLSKIDLSEFNEISSYTSLQEIFTRNLKKQRIFSEVSGDVISPADSKIVQYGDIENGNLLKIKGITYSIKDLLTSNINDENLRIMQMGKFINFYLSPRDYHHFHAPIDFYLQNIVHVPGDLFSVRESVARKKKVFSINERVVMECVIGGNQLCYLIFVGAFGVGNIKIFKESKLQTNSAKKNSPTLYKYTKPIFFKKGEDIGCFNFGSSVVALFSGKIEFKENLLKKKVRFSDTIGSLIINK